MKFTIITATYNCVDVIGDCLASVWSQSHPDVEHIVIDGASTDGTLDILQNHQTRFTSFVSSPDTGLYAALNKGLELATGDVVGFLHADDLFTHQDVLRRVDQKLSADPSIDAIYGDLQYVSRNNLNRIVRHWRSQAFSPNLLARGWMPPHPTFFARRHWYQDIGLFDQGFDVSADYASMLRLFQNEDFKAAYLPEVMVKMRLGGMSNRSVRAMIKKSSEDWRAMRDSGFSRSVATKALVLKNLSKMKQFL